MDAAIAEQTQVCIRDLWKDAALILVGGIPESCFQACRVCGERKSMLTDSHILHDRAGKRVRKTTCKACFAKQQQQYIDRDKEIRLLRRRLAVIEKPSITCIRCNQKKPPTAFPPKDRSCLLCKVEILEALNKSLRDRIACQPGGPRVTFDVARPAENMPASVSNTRSTSRTGP